MGLLSFNAIKPRIARYTIHTHAAKITNPQIIVLKSATPAKALALSPVKTERKMG